MVASWLDGFVSGGVRAVRDHLLVYLPNDPSETSSDFLKPDPNRYLFALHLTIECASYVVTIPMLLLSAFFVGATRVTWGRWALGTISGLAIAFLVNQIRIGLIVFSTNMWGVSGYSFSHTVVGSIIGLIGFVAAFIVMLKIMAVSRKRTMIQQHAPQEA